MRGRFPVGQMAVHGSLPGDPLAAPGTPKVVLRLEGTTRGRALMELDRAGAACLLELLESALATLPALEGC